MGFGYSGLNTDPKNIGYTAEGKDKVRKWIRYYECL